MRPSSTMLDVSIALAIAALLVFGPASGEAEARRGKSTASSSSKSDDLVRLLKRRPRGMSVDTWREQRREAARELGRLKDRRAVPTLLKIIEKERFDVLLEIAIDALGNIGDRRAIGPLRKLLNDPSLDGYVRDAVAGALSKLEPRQADKTPGPTSPGSSKPDRPPRPTTPPPDLATRLAQSGGATGDYAKLPPQPTMTLSPTLLGHAEQFDIVAGAGHIGWDGGAENTSAGIALGTRYRRNVEYKQLGYTLDGAAHIGFRLTNPTGDDNTTWSLDHALQLDSEARYYPFRHDLPELCGQIAAGLGYGLGVGSPAAALENRVAFGSTLSVGLGPAYGRIMDVGARLRLRRFERVLQKAGLIEDEIAGDVAAEIMQLWFLLRNTIGSYAQLGYALRALRKANLITRDVDPASAYRLIRILDDPQLLDRRSGMLFRLGYGYARDLLLDADDRDYGFVYATGELRLQRGTIRELGGIARVYWNHLSDPDSFNVSVEGHYNWFLYNRAFDPLGALGVTAEMGVAKSPDPAFDDGGLAYRVLVGGSYTRYFDRASRVSAALRGGWQSQGGLILFSIEASHGIASGSFVTR